MHLDLTAIFVPEMALEMVLRGTVTYWFLYAMFRFVIGRRLGAVGMADLLVLVIVADAIQNSMAGEYSTVTDGFILVATLIGWTLFTDWLSYAFPALERILQPPPLALIRDGRLLRRNLRAELVTETELMAKVRERGLSAFADVQRAYLEPDGAISIIPRGKRASSS